jgi:hypothetical protein
MDKPKRRNLIVEYEPDGLYVYALRELKQKEMIDTLEQVYGYRMTSAEEQNIAMSSCSDILIDSYSNMYMHTDSQIRTLCDTINVYRLRDIDRGNRAITKVYLPKVEFDKEEK